MVVDLKKTNDELDKFLLRMPDGLREKLKAVAEASSRSMNAEIVDRLSFSLIAHPHAYLIRALIDLHEDLLSNEVDLVVPYGLQNELRSIAAKRGVEPQQLLTSLVSAAIDQLDNETEVGKLFAIRMENISEPETVVPEAAPSESVSAQSEKTVTRIRPRRVLKIRGSAKKKT